MAGYWDSAVFAGVEASNSWGEIERNPNCYLKLKVISLVVSSNSYQKRVETSKEVGFHL